jgi:Ni,Fe-hydrogenase maturation factor
MLGTHAAPLSMFMKMINHETGADVRLVAIQASDTTFGADMTEPVTGVIETLVSQLSELLDGRNDT